MSDETSDTVETGVSVIAETAAGLPEPVQKALGEALKLLLVELVGVPAAWLRRWSTSINDVTDARSQAMKDLRSAAIKDAKGDPEVLQATLEVVTPRSIRKIANRTKVARQVVEELKDAKQDASKAASPAEDWMNTFMRFAEDASSERLQSLFAKILAGQIINPGTFSPATLRAVSELTQQTAQDFEWLWSKNFGYDVFGAAEFKKGEKWELLKRLDEAGLAHSELAATFNPPWRPENGLSRWMLGDPQTGHWLLLLRNADTNGRVLMVKLTGTGLELGKILPAPDYEANLRNLASEVPKPGLALIQLITPKGTELIWTKQ